MSKINPEQLLEIATNSHEYGYQSYALFDINLYSEEELSQYLMNAIVCLMSENAHLTLVVMAGNAKAESDFYLNAASSLGNIEVYPKLESEVTPDQEASENALARYDQYGFPIAILTLLQQKNTQEIVAFLATPKGLNPRPPLRELAKTAMVKYRDSISKKN